MHSSRKNVVLAYRHIYRHGLRAVQYSAPARYTLRDRLRNTFRKGTPSDFSRDRIDKTLQFLDGAARSKGIEHRIVKTLLFVWFHEPYSIAKRLNSKERAETKIKSTAYDHFYHTLDMLNESVGMCIR
ncbi:hypothetical protein B0A49_01189 [Cryomyces minteri]|uniref:DUF1763-domain-containing protein n=1 Tax=Cryomyces minteri TaxID=331657 RepID=A0A4U0XRX6_9PEZI|nr:hypothetical protein B0A49_01189 [Cryomyces minteri]